ncbi:probable ATP-dependent RNA helicase DDX28 [Onthophagus taurus]|uniref:probable ATP-dependent RNA helicase DDX28 n=1 Tax=Onthophagus taurus TaxID=166361 RepID=UPI000C207348|nr:probable ATP-dependent RNA helicase DDX28 [Onthophagus taurus]
MTSNLLKSTQKLLNFTLQTRRYKSSNPPIITCFRKDFNMYQNTTYEKLKEIPLASKGWAHRKAAGDYFMIHAQQDNYDKPSINFNELNIQNSLIKVLNYNNIEQATSFQANTIPVIQSGQHVMMAAETGCGKTIAYLLPIIQNVAKEKANDLNTPKALIVVPNRELAFQIGDVAKPLCDAMNVSIHVLVGGRTKKMMINPLFDDIDILIATPGVIGKLSTAGIYKLKDVAHTVFDEADTLLDDSFNDRIGLITKRVSQSQFILVSATLPKNIPDFLQPITEQLVTIKSDRLHRPLLNVNQKFLRLSQSARPGHLLSIAKNAKSKLLIFTNRNESCNWLAMFLRENGLKCANINGEMNYHIRVDQWKQFINDEVKILSSTDVGSRGLDIKDVKHVINYDFPLYASDYIHRVGRTGRLGSLDSCKISNFICGLREIKLVQQIELSVRTNTEIPNVDGNIKALVEKEIMRKIREVG